MADIAIRKITSAPAADGGGIFINDTIYVDPKYNINISWSERTILITQEIGDDKYIGDLRNIEINEHTNPSGLSDIIDWLKLGQSDEGGDDGFTVSIHFDPVYFGGTGAEDNPITWVGPNDGGHWGNITGDISDQTDLWGMIEAGDNIVITPNEATNKIKVSAPINGDGIRFNEDYDWTTGSSSFRIDGPLGDKVFPQITLKGEEPTSDRSTITNAEIKVTKGSAGSNNRSIKLNTSKLTQSSNESAVCWFDFDKSVFKIDENGKITLLNGPVPPEPGHGRILSNEKWIVSNGRYVYIEDPEPWTHGHIKSNGLWITSNGKYMYVLTPTPPGPTPVHGDRIISDGMELVSDGNYITSTYDSNSVGYAIDKMTDYIDQKSDTIYDTIAELKEKVSSGRENDFIDAILSIKRELNSLRNIIIKKDGNT